MAKTVNIISYRQDVLNELQNKVRLALESVGSTAADYAADDCPVDTSRLKNSISHKVKGNAVYIGTNVVYAKQVEYNDRAKHENGKAHYLRDAATTHGDEYKALVEAALKE